jgi:hypothetical protein
MADERVAEREERVKVVYCGGCNPHIDRSAVAAGLPLDDPDVGPGATVHLSGCPRACASDHQLAGSPGDEAAGEAPAAEAAPAAAGAASTADAPVTIIVAGELVDGVPTPEAQLAPTITRKLKE